jgi:hypothetical protein
MSFTAEERERIMAEARANVARPLPQRDPPADGDALERWAAGMPKEEPKPARGLDLAEVDARIERAIGLARAEDRDRMREMLTELVVTLQDIEQSRLGKLKALTAQLHDANIALASLRGDVAELRAALSERAKSTTIDPLPLGRGSLIN